MNANLPIHVVGAGASGSRVVREIIERETGLACEIHVWDGDTVGEENLRAQTYTREYVGEPKARAIAEQARAWGSEAVIPHPLYVTERIEFRGVVFLCADLASARKTWEHSLKNNPGVKLIIETRLETAGSLIHVVDPCNAKHIRKWEHYWYPDSEASTAGMSCGTATSRGPIASLTASLSVWQLVRFAQIQAGYADRLDNQIRVRMHPLTVQTFQW